MDSLRVSIGETNYPITFGGDLSGWLEGVLAGFGGCRYVLLLVDENVQNLHGDRILGAFRQAAVEVRVIAVPPGESTKSIEVYSQLCDEVLRYGPDRSTPLFSCGGGVTGDTAGFVAATVLRGLPLFQIPTTTLSQADSAVGGKVGLNHGSGKNLIGAFYQPRAVFIDPAFTRTLSDRDYLSGLFEVMKMGLVLDQRLNQYLLDHWEALESRQERILSHVLLQSCRLKARVVELDEQERGPRRVLNFGHTVGHVIEHLSGGTLRHGEAVAWGMAAAVALSVERAGLDRDRASAITDFILRPSALMRPVLPDRDSFIRVLDTDKKRNGQNRGVVLLRSVGRTVINQDIDSAEIWQAATDALQTFTKKGGSE